ncbi:hypothetical protein HMPREF9997_01585 [Corynebacterium durum F0235]|uniref:Uncharacterized protein n=1 Tax=Corynebacterium durum F0235 TaxID=1035195 RepID=L1MFS0_9CORY|nr:hypothetical protein HMPREF9997_01585 [Corynebacterium durum F0235]
METSSPGSSPGVQRTMSDTKYRDIADGNSVRLADEVKAASQIPSTAI